MACPTVQECAVCWKTKPTTQYYPCKHYICPSCTMRNLKYRQTCPLCRKTIEYCSPKLVEYDNSRSREISITVKPNKMLGITIVCSEDKIKVIRAIGMAKDLGMRKGDVIYGINGMPCCNKACVMKLFSTAKENSSTLNVTLSPLPCKPTSKWRIYTMFAFRNKNFNTEGC